MSQHGNIVAGYGEKTLVEEFNLPVILPMKGTAFLALVDGLKLHRESCGERGSEHELPPPRQVSGVDLSNAVKCIEIDGDVDAVRHIGKRYRAFLDANDNVIYIENAFSYTGP